MPELSVDKSRILIVEDEPMIALALEEMLLEAGFAVAAIAGKLGKALELVESGACDAAVVDANLAGISTSSVASALTLRGLPFVVLSGYSRDQLLGDFSGAPFIQKPYRTAELIDTLNGVILKQ